MPAGKQISSDGSVSVGGGASVSSSFASKAPARVNANAHMSRIMMETIVSAGPSDSPTLFVNDLLSTHRAKNNGAEMRLTRIPSF